MRRFQEAALDELKTKVIRGSIAKLLGQSIALLIRLVFLAIMARLLAPQDFGLVAMVTVVTGIFELFSTAGLSAATVQQASISAEEVSTLFWINLVVGALLSLLCLASAPCLAAFYEEPRLLWITAALASGFIISSAGVQHLALLQRDLRYVSLAVIETIAQVGAVAIGIGMALAGLGYWALVGATLAVRVTTTACLWATAGWTPFKPRTSVETGRLLRFGGTITMNNLIIYLGYNLDKALLGRFWGADALGLYGRAFQLIDIPTSSINSALGGVAFAALSRLQTDPARFRAYFLKGYSLINALTMPITIFCLLFANDIILFVLGAKWNDAVLLFRLLAPTILVFGIINPTGWFLQSIGLQVRSLKLALAIAPLVLVACLMGLPYGPAGVAFAFSTAMALWVVPHILWCCHKTFIPPADLFAALCRPGLASLSSAMLVYLAVPYIAPFHSVFLRLAACGGAMAFIYAFVLLIILDQKATYLDIFRSLKATSRA
ncbi:lipopolysaccharide biosynthesis protein [Nordella sp. HKS 07]|uniref:lipopolysaccharide biosynthesis protein n=1 Tax=Nordella sp. HKS 07 TaxID=2712222 RepID=UPI0013E1DACD|nr:lipopolysaccharide biosynthesis protein [Nordella sp. HKS 07]QIG51832.1 lipopolysaccharide biosynthesis protein [Nordella sp. HKS 07]